MGRFAVYDPKGGKSFKNAFDFTKKRFVSMGVSFFLRNETKRSAHHLPNRLWGPRCGKASNPRDSGYTRYVLPLNSPLTQFSPRITLQPSFWPLVAKEALSCAEFCSPRS